MKFDNMNYTLCDPCAGTGAMLLYAVKKCGYKKENCYGIELDELNVAILRKLGFVNIIQGDASDPETWEKFGKNMKFDRIIMNPPYNGNLHLKILQEAIKHADEVVNLSPIRWLQDPLAEYKKNSDWKRFSNIREKTADLEVVNAKEASDLFGMLVSTDLGIYHITDNAKGVDLRDKLVLKIYKSGNHFEKFDKNLKNGWRVRVCLIDNCKAGGSSKNGHIRFQRLIAFKDGEKNGKPWYDHFSKCGWSKETDYIPTSLPFNSELEAANFIDVMTNTKLGKFYWTHLQQDIHVLPCFFLKLDYTHSWTDEMLYDYFNLTQEERETIENELHAL